MRVKSGTAGDRRGRRARALGVAAAAALAVTVATGAAPAASAAPVEGSALSWGANDVGQLGNGTTTNRSTPGQIPGALQSRVIQVAAGSMHGVALRSNGRVWTWGDNSLGQLGDGTTTPRRAPAQLNALRDITQVAAARFTTVALRSDGTVWGWGDNFDGQLGDGTTMTERHAPVQVQGLTGITQIAAGEFFTVALRNDGTVWAWGSDFDGSLGDGDVFTNHPTPVRVLAPSGITQIATGQGHTVARRSDGTVWTWGDNDFGQLGDGGATRRRSMPLQVAGLTGVSSVAAGEFHSLVVAGGRVFGWGRNNNGELGDGTATNRLSPIQVPGLPPAGGATITTVAAGELYSMVLTSDHKVFAWGLNGSGQLGDGTMTERHSPVQVAGLTRPVQQIVGGAGFTLALAT